MKKFVRNIAFVAALSVGMVTAHAWAPGQMVIPEDTYYWIQSTDRMNYYVEWKKIVYAVNEDGTLDFGKLTVPIIKSYDGIQVKDVIERRRWNNLSTEGFDHLAGENGILEVDLLEKTVTLKKVSYLNYSLKVIEEMEPKQSVEILKLPEKHVERRFYEGIIAFENSNSETIIKNTRSKLTNDELKQLVKERKKTQKEIEKKYKK